MAGWEASRPIVDGGSPLAPESDDEKPADKKKKEEPKKDDEDKPADKPEVKIDFDNIGQRILALPLPARRYVDLQLGKGGVVFALESSAPPSNDPPTLTVYRYDFGKRKSDTPLSDV